MDNLNPTPRKIYTSKQIGIGTFFGGPLASGILIAKNYKLLGEDGAAKKSIYLGILTTLILGLFLYLAPNSLLDRIPNQLIPFINVGAVYLIIHFFLKDKINKHLSEGGEKESYWKVTGIGLLCAVATILVFLIPIINKPPYEGNVKYFGKTKDAIYYDPGISYADIDKIGDTLNKIGIFNDQSQIELQVRKEKVNLYHIYFTVNQKGFEDKDLVEPFKKIGKIIQDNLTNKKIKISFFKNGLSKPEIKNIL